MLTISFFHGIAISMHRSNMSGEVPNIRATCLGIDAVFSIEDCTCLEGGLPDRQRRLVEAWIELRREDLAYNWGFDQIGYDQERIDPLH